MASTLKKNWFKVVAAVLLVALALGLAYNFWWGASRLPFINRSPDFTFTNSNGKVVHFSDSDGKIRLIAFIYTSCPDTCPLITAKMVRLQNDLKKQGMFGKDVEFLSISTDPKNDTIQALTEYAGKYNADLSGWEFLRGTEEHAQQVAEGLGVTIEKQSDGTVMHSNRVFLVDKDKNVRRTYLITDSDVSTSDIVKDMQTLSHQ